MEKILENFTGLDKKEKNLFRLILSILESSGLLEAFLRVLIQFIKGKYPKCETLSEYGI